MRVRPALQDALSKFLENEGQRRHVHGMFMHANGRVYVEL
jgi:hypothetical protein